MQFFLAMEGVAATQNLLWQKRTRALCVSDPKTSETHNLHTPRRPHGLCSHDSHKDQEATSVYQAFLTVCQRDFLWVQRL